MLFVMEWLRANLLKCDIETVIYVLFCLFSEEGKWYLLSNMYVL